MSRRTRRAMGYAGLVGLLADTWWFGLTSRLPEPDFRDLAVRRVRQGFSAVQLVVGIPPEVGPENENARSPAGFPWTLDGQFNKAYFRLAKERIEYLNSLGLRAVVYGAWGHQIEWLGRERMAEWWHWIVKTLDELDVVYCLCGESNLWVGQAGMLLPDKTTAELPIRSRFSWFPPRLRAFLITAARRLEKRLLRHRWEARRQGWGFVLEELARSTDRPILIHPTADETGYEAVPNPQWLAANTAQTGHDERARDRLWRLPLELHRRGLAPRGYINLEPWYEGIGGRFWAPDQLYAYWASMLAGALGHCYGAHGIWNVGDGTFLAHWGGQTFAQAMALDTPRLIGLSHRLLMEFWEPGGESFYQAKGGGLVTIGRRWDGRAVQFFPDVARAEQMVEGRFWLPLEGAFAGSLPSGGPVVVLHEGDRWSL